MNDCFVEIKKQKKYEVDLYIDNEDDRDLGWEKV